MIKYTICFLKRQSRFLMLNRLHPPIMGLWNGVGGKLEPDEAPLSGVLREVLEETGIPLKSAAYKGMVTWAIDGASHGGMHAFIAEVPDDFDIKTPVLIDEGILDWRELEWILHPENAGVPENLPFFLPDMLAGDDCFHYHFCYSNGTITSHEKTPLSEAILQSS
ncbi:NUDIX hydrolase [Brevibacillus choshinensis]|uniref:8-oxo-dGTP diphosphatase n=1 Tax=Brevibacillus choshinensis TaxID=54911 RepID=A0ABX7FWM4_BRECH|nr:8-oxo-dGTP diphosphatase [Brevibacillus choshinensis]QRG69981.1 8-oxo-dGTP diphosphatase [Brevibacillus choshinensis]